MCNPPPPPPPTLTNFLFRSIKEHDAKTKDQIENQRKVAVNPRRLRPRWRQEAHWGQKSREIIYQRLIFAFPECSGATKSRRWPSR